MRRAPGCLMAVLTVLSAATTAFLAASPPSEKPPQWLSAESAKPLPALSPETEAVVLLEERSIDVRPVDVIMVRARRAIKVLRPSGVDKVRSFSLANTFAVRVKSMDAWTLKPGGTTKKRTLQQALATSFAPGTLYTDAEALFFTFPELEAGDILGLEWTEERRPPSFEDTWMFQGQFPVLRARYIIGRGAARRSELHWVNRQVPAESFDSTDVPGGLSLELSDIPAIEAEPFRPDERALAGRLVVHLRPASHEARSFSDWKDMGAWYESLSSPCREPVPEIAAWAEKLAAGCGDRLAELQALADFVQKDIRYVSIQIGIGGFKPHAAFDILKNRYGDCKDKATLLSALLQVRGIRSYYLLVNTIRGIVTSGSPVSLWSFDHAILAIGVPEGIPTTGFDALVQHARLGPLLVFDPTMPTTPLGRLPFYLQGNTALLVADGGGELIPLPWPSPERNLLQRRGRFRLAEDGTLRGEVREVRSGSEADSLRYSIAASDEAGRRRYLEAFIARTMADPTLENYSFGNLEDPHQDLVVEYSFSASGYINRTGDLMIIRPPLLGSRVLGIFEPGKERPRRHPLDLETTVMLDEEFVLELPAALKVESLPRVVTSDAGFAAYQSSSRLEGSSVTFKREYVLREPWLPASRAGEVNRFYQSIAADERQKMLLK